jgi:hypothetical protein
VDNLNAVEVEQLVEFSDELAAIEAELGGIERASQSAYWQLIFRKWWPLAEQHVVGFRRCPSPEKAN